MSWTLIDTNRGSWSCNKSKGSIYANHLLHIICSTSHSGELKEKHKVQFYHVTTLVRLTDTTLRGVLPCWLTGTESACQCRRCECDLWVRKIPWRKQGQPTPVFLPGTSHGQRSLTCYSPWSHKSQTQDRNKTTTTTRLRGKVEEK